MLRLTACMRKLWSEKNSIRGDLDGCTWWLWPPQHSTCSTPEFQGVRPRAVRPALTYSTQTWPTWSFDSSTHSTSNFLTCSFDLFDLFDHLFFESNSTFTISIWLGKLHCTLNWASCLGEFSLSQRELLIERELFELSTKCVTCDLPGMFLDFLANFLESSPIVPIQNFIWEFSGIFLGFIKLSPLGSNS